MEKASDRPPEGRERSQPGRALPTEGPLLAIDPGSKRIGLAISDFTQTVARPLATLVRRSGKRFPLRRLRTQLEEHGPVGLLIGLPVAADGSEDVRAEVVRALGSTLAAETGLPVVYWDERFTTARALTVLKDLGSDLRDRKHDLDRLAAAVLLQTFLDSRRQ